MSEHPNVAPIRAAYEAFNARDLSKVLPVFATDLVMHGGGDGELAGDHHGHAGLSKVIGHGLELTGGTQQLALRHVFADETHAVVHVRETATRAADGAALDVEEVHLLGLDASGRIREFWDIPADPARHNAFFDGKPLQ